MPSYYRDSAAPRPNVPRRIGVTALIERDGTFLVERRSDDPEHWAFVGGRLDEEESALQALEREVLEETGYTIDHATLVGVFSDPSRVIEYPDGNVCRFVSLVFRVRTVERTEPVPSDESRQLRFVTPAQLARLELWPVHLPVRDALLSQPNETLVA